MSPKSLSDIGNKFIPAVECLITHKNNILLMKRSEKSKKFPGYWAAPGGHVDEHEDFLTAAIREVREETGIDVSGREIKLKTVAIGKHMDRKEIYMVLYFLVNLKNYHKPHSSKEGKAEWIPINSLKNMKNLFPPLKHYYERGLDEKGGIWYTNVDLKNAEVKNIRSIRHDKDC